MKVRFIVNPTAGGVNRVGELTDSIRRVLGSEPGFFEVKVTTEKGGAETLAREAVLEGYDVVVACGGDGTVNEVASALVSAPVALGIVPFGSGNGLALSLGIPLEVDAALSKLKEPARRLKMDVGTVCGRHFFATAGFGFDALLAKKYNEGSLSARVRGILPYIPIAIKEFYRYSPEKVEIVIGNRHIEVTPFILTVANVPRFGGNAVIAPDAKPDDGLLDLVIVPEVGLKKSYQLTNKLMKGQIDSFKGYQCIRAEEIEIRRDKSAMVHADGEPFEWQGSIHVSCLRAALNVLI